MANQHGREYLQKGIFDGMFVVKDNEKSMLGFKKGYCMRLSFCGN